MKRGQIFSTEVYIAIVLFLVALVAFYAIISTKDAGDTVEEEAERIAGNLMAHEYFQDGILTAEELDDIEDTWNCTYMKQIFGTTKSVCIYMKDEEGNLKLFDGRQFQGCDDVEIGSQACEEP